MLLEIFRHSFPRGIRYCRQCRHLHAGLTVVLKRAKAKKHVPKSEIRDVLAAFTPIPLVGTATSPLGLRVRRAIQSPPLRWLLLLDLMNIVRTRHGDQSWLFTRAVDAEYEKVAKWLQAQDAAEAALKAQRTGTAKSGGGVAIASKYPAPPPGYVDRQQFQDEVVDALVIAATFHRVMRALAFTVVALIALLIVEVFSEDAVYVYLRWWLRLSDAEIYDFLVNAQREQTECEVVSEYQEVLPPPCVLVTTPADSATGRPASSEYVFNIVEVTSAIHNITVVFVPTPQCGTNAFFERIGGVARACDAVLLEGVDLFNLDRLMPAYLFPLKDLAFPRAGLQARYMDLARGSGEPPRLFPGAIPVSNMAGMMQLIVPPSWRCVYWPQWVFGTRAEARIGWGQLRRFLEDGETLAELREGIVETDETLYAAAPDGGDGAKRSTHRQPVTSTARVVTNSYGEIELADAHLTLCVPWSVPQIANLQASLLRFGDFRVVRTHHLRWLAEDELARRFCATYGLHPPQLQPDNAAAASAAAVSGAPA